MSRTREMLGEATAGGAAGVLAVASTYPLMVAKTRLQAQRRRDTAGSDGHAGDGAAHYKNALDCVLQVARSEGVRGLFKGLSSSLPKAFVTNFIFYFAYTLVKPLFKGWKNKLLAHMLQGVAAGSCVQIIMSPIEMVNTRVIADKTGKTRFAQTFMDVLRTKGCSGLYQGLLPQLVLTLNPGITNVVRHLITPSGDQASASKNFWTGAGSKACASMSTYPYVVAKVQIFTYDKSPGDDAAHDHRELSVVGVITRILREEGPLGLYKGCELQVGTAVAKEALLNTARYPLRAFVMRLFLGSAPVVSSSAA